MQLKLFGQRHRIVKVMDEEAIITAIQAGDTEQFRALVERYHVGLIIHCEGLVADRDTAEDLAQEAFIKAYRKIAEFNGSRARFSTWLYRIATNAALDYLRARRRTVPQEDIEQLADESAPDFSDELQRQLVRDAVARLTPPTHRQAIEAYYWHGHSYQQIASDLGVPVNTVRTWLRRAKQQLRSDLS